MSERSIEVKVGALILVALGLLIAFVLILGRVTTTEGFRINVLFIHPGGLTPGAPVKIAGGEVGHVEEMVYLGADGPLRPLDPSKVGSPPDRTRVKVVIWVEERVRTSIQTDATYYVTMLGLLGEPFLEIDPGTSGAAVNPETTVFGIDPPRLDVALANGANSLETLNRVLTRNEDQIDELIAGAASALKTVDTILTDNREELEGVVVHADEFLVESRDTMRGARRMYIDNPRIKRTLVNLDTTTTLIASRDEEVLQNIEQTIELARELLEVVGPDQREQIQSAIADLSSVMGSVDSSAEDAQAIVARVRRGEGTIGALLIDEEVYDDLKELLRDLKHNPWKFFWRE